MHMSVLKNFQLMSSILSALMTSLDVTNLRAWVCPNPGNSKPSISITLDVPIFSLQSLRYDVHLANGSSVSDAGWTHRWTRFPLQALHSTHLR